MGLTGAVNNPVNVHLCALYCTLCRCWCTATWACLAPPPACSPTWSPGTAWRWTRRGNRSAVTDAGIAVVLSCFALQGEKTSAGQTEWRIFEAIDWIGPKTPSNGHKQARKRSRLEANIFKCSATEARDYEALSPTVKGLKTYKNLHL